MKVAQGIYITPNDIAQLTRQLHHTLQLNFKSQQVSRHLGYHMTRLRGRGMSFAESREYQPGDEIRHIDWRVTARTSVTHTKTFEEERDRPIFIVLDQSPSLFIGSSRCFKSYLAAELALGFGWLACRNQDRFGGICVGRELNYTPLKSGRKHWSHFCETIIESNQSWDLEHDQEAINWDLTLHSLKKHVRPGSLVIIISDFFNQNIQEQDLSQLRRHADIICVSVDDPIERDPPAINGTLSFGGLQWFYKGQSQDRLKLRNEFVLRSETLKKTCAKLGIGFFTASTAQTALHNLEAIIR